MVGLTGIGRVVRALVVLAAVTLAGTVWPGAGERGWRPAECAGGGPGRVRASPMRAAPSVWFRLVARLDAAGALAGQVLTVAQHGSTVRRTLALPPESFAAGPFGGLILLGEDDGMTSRLSTIDVANGCESPIATSPDVIRSATIDPSGATLYDVRVDRTTRADLGVWRRPLDGSAPARRILSAPRPDDRFGTTWSSTFEWSFDGDRLAIQTCGEVACRARVLDPATGHVDLLAEPDVGPLVGLTRDRVVSHAACRGLPCPLLATSPSGTDRVVLALDGGPAVLARIGPEVRVVDTTWDGSGRRLRATSFDGAHQEDLGPLPSGEDLVTDAATTGFGDLAPIGSVLLARIGPPGDSVSPALIRHLTLEPPLSRAEGRIR